MNKEKHIVVDASKLVEEPHSKITIHVDLTKKEVREYADSKAGSICTENH